MNGTVTRLRSRGVEATMDGDVSTILPEDTYQLYRHNSDGTEFIVGNTFPKRSRGPSLICLNAVDGTTLAEPMLGDLVRKI